MSRYQERSSSTTVAMKIFKGNSQQCCRMDSRYGAGLGLDGGLSADIEKSDVFDQTRHPCHLYFERFGTKIDLVKRRLDKILNKYTSLPECALNLLARSFLPEKAKRNYTRIVNERINCLIRESE